MHSTTLERMQRSFNECVIHANGGDLNLQFLDPKLLFYFLLDRMPGLRAQAANALVGVVTGKSSQIHAGNRPQKPCRLPIFFYGSSRDIGFNAALDCAGGGSAFSYPTEVEGNAGIWQQRTSGERGNRTAAVVRDTVCDTSKLIVFDRHQVFSANLTCEKTRRFVSGHRFSDATNPLKLDAPLGAGSQGQNLPRPIRCRSIVRQIPPNMNSDCALTLGTLHGYATARFLTSCSLRSGGYF